jgi:hypothetical protein
LGARGKERFALRQRAILAGLSAEACVEIEHLAMRICATAVTIPVVS